MTQQFLKFEEDEFNLHELEISEPCIASTVKIPLGGLPLAFGGAEGRNSAFPINGLGETGSAMVRALVQKYQCPPALCAQAVLCTMSTTVSSLGLVEAIYGAGVPLAVYLITVAQSGERKTVVDVEAQRGIRVYERELAVELEALRAATPDKASAEMLPSADIIVNDPTFEGLIKAMARGPGFACLSNDDAAGFFGGNSMSKDNRQKTIAGLSQMWSGSAIKRPRAHGQDTELTGVPLTISLMFQPYLISQVFGDREMVEQGILPRMLPCYPYSTMGTRFFRKPTEKVEDTIRSFSEWVYETLVKAKQLKEARVAPSDKFGSAQSVLRLSNTAQKILISFHDEVEGQLAAGGKFEKERGFASKATENATRIAGIVTLFDDVDATEVTGEAAEGACELMRYYMAEFSYLLSLGKSQKDDSEAASLGLWLVHRYGAGGIGHDKDIGQFGPAEYRKKGSRQHAMSQLVDHGWIEMLPKGTVVDGVARAEAFRINARIGEIL